MARTVEITILYTEFNTGMMPHLADVNLTAFRPNDSTLFRQFRQPFIHVVVIA